MLDKQIDLVNRLLIGFNIYIANIRQTVFITGVYIRVFQFFQISFIKNNGTTFRCTLLVNS